MLGTEITKQVEYLGFKAAQISRVSRLPGISTLVGNYIEEERMHIRQDRLQPFAGRLVLVGGNFGDRDRTDGTLVTPERNADRTSRKLFEEQIISIGRPVVIRTLLQSMSANNSRAEGGAQLLTEAVERNYGISPYLIPEPKTILAKDGKNEALALRTSRTIDEAIIELPANHDARDGEIPPYQDPHLVLMLVARDAFASEALPMSISFADMKMGGTALLSAVGDTPEQNVWLPESTV